MKHIFLLISLFFTFTLASVAQKGGDGGRVEALKIGYFTRKLNLTTDEAQRFWPTYNRYVAEVKQFRQQNKDMDEIAQEEKIVNIRKKYKSEFSAVLGDDRTNEFFRADKDFNNYIRRELQDRRQGNRF